MPNNHHKIKFRSSRKTILLNQLRIVLVRIARPKKTIRKKDRAL